MADVKQGAAYRFDGETPIGIDSNALPVDQVVEVREVVQADITGAHDDSEDAVVVEWDAPALVRGENGMEVGSTRRAMSIGMSFFETNFVKEG